MSLHETIYQLRTARGLSQLELAEALDVSRQSISKWETGAAVPELEKLVRLSDVFGITLDELVRGTAEGAPKEDKGEAPPSAVIIERRGMEPHRIVALVVLCTGILLTFLMVLLGDTRTGLVLGAPVVAAAALFLALPRRHLLWGFWVLLIAAVWILRRLTGGWWIALGSFSVPVSIFSAATIVSLVLLIVATVRRLKK